MSDANEYLGDLTEICNIDTFRKLGEIYLKGRGGIYPDVATALEYFLKAAALGNNFAERKLAELNSANQ